MNLGSALVASVRGGVGHATRWANQVVWQIFKTAHHKVEDFREGRTRQTDEEFLSECCLDDLDAREVALGVRRAVAHVGLIDPLLIHASDRFPEELGGLPLWDSMDWVALILELEYQLGYDMPEPIRDWKLQGSFSVKELVRDVVARRPTQHARRDPASMPDTPSV